MYFKNTIIIQKQFNDNDNLQPMRKCGFNLLIEVVKSEEKNTLPFRHNTKCYRQMTDRRHSVPKARPIVRSAKNRRKRICYHLLHSTPQIHQPHRRHRLFLLALDCCPVLRHLPIARLRASAHLNLLINQIPQSSCITTRRPQHYSMVHSNGPPKETSLTLIAGTVTAGPVPVYIHQHGGTS